MLLKISEIFLMTSSFSRSDPKHLSHYVQSQPVLRRGYYLQKVSPLNLPELALLGKTGCGEREEGEKSLPFIHLECFFSCISTCLLFRGDNYHQLTLWTLKPHFPQATRHRSSAGGSQL